MEITKTHLYFIKKGERIYEALVAGEMADRGFRDDDFLSLSLYTLDQSGASSSTQARIFSQLEQGIIPEVA